RQRHEGGPAVRAEVGTASDAPKRMPAKALDLLEQPRGPQAPVAQRHHQPAGWHHAAQRLEQVQPVRLPTPLGGGGKDLPGHGEGTTAVKHADAQQHEAVIQSGGVQGQRQTWLGPVAAQPAPPRGEASSDVQVLTLAAGLDRGGQIPLAQARADREFGLIQPGGQGGGDAVQSTPARQGRADGPFGQSLWVWVAEAREGRRKFLGPKVQGVLARHGTSPYLPEGAPPSGWGNLPVLPSPCCSSSYDVPCGKTQAWFKTAAFRVTVRTLFVLRERKVD